MDEIERIDLENNLKEARATLSDVLDNLGISYPNRRLIEECVEQIADARAALDVADDDRSNW